MEQKLKELEYAKLAVAATLASHNTLVDMHGLSYWAGVVDRLRQELLSQI